MPTQRNKPLEKQRSQSVMQHIALYPRKVLEEKMHQLTFIAVLFAGISLEAVAQDLSLPTCYRDPRLSKAHRLEGIKVEILQRLGLDKEPCNPDNITEIKDPEFLKKYELVKESWEVKDAHRPPCASLDFRSMEVLPFRPVRVERVQRSARVAENAECPSKSSEVKL